MQRAGDEFRIEHVDDVSIIRLPGPQLDRWGARSFRAHLRDGLSTCAPRVLLDLGELETLASAGLGAILDCLKEMRHRDVDLRLCGPTPTVRMLFELLRVHRIVDVFESREAALADWSSPRPRQVGSHG
jgi:anti-sigma B factor antagonist